MEATHPQTRRDAERKTSTFLYTAAALNVCVLYTRWSASRRRCSTVLCCSLQVSTLHGAINTRWTGISDRFWTRVKRKPKEHASAARSSQSVHKVYTTVKPHRVSGHRPTSK